MCCVESFSPLHSKSQYLEVRIKSFHSESLEDRRHQERLTLLYFLSPDRIIGVVGCNPQSGEMVSLALNCLISSYQKAELTVHFSQLVPSQNCLWNKQMVIICSYLREPLSVYLSRKLSKPLWQYCWALWAPSECDYYILVRLSFPSLELFFCRLYSRRMCHPLPIWLQVKRLVQLGVLQFILWDWSENSIQMAKRKTLQWRSPMSQTGSQESGKVHEAAHKKL